MSKPEPEWSQHIDALNKKLFQLHALSYAIYTSTLNLVQAGEIPPLASLSLRLCEEAEEHVAALGAYCGELSRLVNKEVEGSGEEHDQ